MAEAFKAHLDGLPESGDPNLQTQREARVEKSLRVEADKVLRMLEGKEPFPPLRLLDADAYALLARSYLQQVGLGQGKEAERELRQFVDIVTAKPRGRPPTIRLETLHEIKRLHDQGLEAAQIAKRLKVSRQVVTTTLKREFPTQKP